MKTLMLQVVLFVAIVCITGCRQYIEVKGPYQFRALDPNQIDEINLLTTISGLYESDPGKWWDGTSYKEVFPITDKEKIKNIMTYIKNSKEICMGHLMSFKINGKVYWVAITWDFKRAYGTFFESEDLMNYLVELGIQEPAPWPKLPIIEDPNDKKARIETIRRP
jgi:hypothetical protein